MRSLFDITGSASGDEIVVDLFAGGGGASEGIRMALGRDPEAAVNHNPLAVAMHAANHPGTVHFTDDVWAVSPSWVTQGRKVGLLWASPDCTHFSKAKGGAPVRNDRIRSLAMVLVDKWIPEVRPRIIIMENVEEMTTWGPLDCRGRIIDAAKGDTFRAFIRRIRRAGYAVEWRELRACDYGAPTIRKRLFLIARCDGQPIVWPAPTHGDPKSEAVQAGELLPWRTAAECIDWSIPCPSIFDTSEEIKAKHGINAKRPLAEKTLKRIAEGIRRYVLEAERPFVVNLTHGVRLEDVAEPMRTVTGAHRGEKAVVTPCISSPAHSTSTGRSKYVWGPLEPLRTVTGGGGFTLVSPMLEAHYGGDGARAMRLPDIQEPLRTMSTENRFGLVSPTLIQTGYGEREGQAPRVPGLDKPLGTAVAGGVKHAVVSAFLAKHFTGVVGAPVTAPAPTVTTVDHNALVAASLSAFYGKSVGQEAGEPSLTVTSKERHALVASNLVKLRGDNVGQPSDQPLATVSAGGTHHAEVRAFLMKYYSEGGQDQAASDPMHTLTTKARMGLVTVAGQEYYIADIGMRMLQPRELFRAQGFPDSYIIDRGADGRPMTKTDQVRMCGNSVCPPMAAALVAANVALRVAGEVAA
ncbi:DNA cytosine methyltransferase [Pseudodesulfovibrio pelocollis]|uniref:DNA cytosine methyltransferase n=1 Tax=Pseudodesulfovibrio pelocollis TaxID=3051432 RepID=UPI00255A76AF|nr:DNA cytosine methyltransferase [Pseudodesulfovibrio sp. SB368]